jgi:hypothetical protein
METERQVLYVQVLNRIVSGKSKESVFFIYSIWDPFFSSACVKT